MGESKYREAGTVPKALGVLPPLARKETSKKEGKQKTVEGGSSLL